MRTAGFAAALLSISLFAAPNLADALTISAEPGPDCFSLNPDKCIGGVYTLEITPTGGNAYVAKYTMDLTVGLDISATTIEQIDFKVATDYGSSFSVISGPGGIANWSLEEGPLSGGGCGGSNGDFICVDAVNPVSVALSTYVWEIGFTADKLMPESEWHVGARFASPTHRKGWILSAEAPIPEPGSMAMFLIGGLLVAALVGKQVLTAR